MNDDAHLLHSTARSAQNRPATGAYHGRDSKFNVSQQIRPGLRLNVVFDSDFSTPHDAGKKFIHVGTSPNNHN